MKKLSFFLITFSSFVVAQSKKIEQSIATLYETSLTDGASYDWLDHLSNQIGGRLSGSLNAERAVQWGKEELDQMGLDRVYLQEVMVPKWVRGTFEYANIETSPGNTINVPICALGGSIATPATGIRAGVVEVQSVDELKSLGARLYREKLSFLIAP